MATKKTTIADVMDAPSLAKLKEDFKRACVESGVPLEMVEEFTATGLPKLLEALDKILTVDAIGLVCLCALIGKGYKPFYGNYGGKNNVACVSDPYIGTPHSFSAAILMELDNWYQRANDESHKRATPSGSSSNPNEDKSVS